MNTTQNLTLQLPVGQLAKNPIYSLDSAPVLTLRVGRHTKQTPHASTRTHEGEPAPDFNAEKLLSLPDLELKNYLLACAFDQQLIFFSKLKKIFLKLFFSLSSAQQLI